MIKEDVLKQVIVAQQQFLAGKEKLWKREYETDATAALENDLITFITGVRRSGKSYLLKIIKRLAAKQKKLEDRNFLYINFEDERLANIQVEQLSTVIELYYRLYQPNTQKQTLLLFDEIQHVPSWGRWINRLYEEKEYKIFVTGSNASLLKKETGKILTGRSTSIEVFPLSFREYWLYFKEKKPVTEKDFYHLPLRAELLNAFESYMTSGGFPEYLKTGNILVLQEYFKDIIQRDIIYRYSIRYKKELKELARLIVSGPGNITSYKSFASAVGMKNANTTKNYLEYLQESYLVFGLPFFSPSLKKQIYNANKYYSIDPGLYHAVSFQLSENQGPLLENIVFLHLKRRLKGLMELFYYKTKSGLEVDFLLKERGKMTLFQVCYNMDDEKTSERETRALVEAAKEIGLGGGIIVNGSRKEHVVIDGIDISIIPAMEFLLADPSCTA